MRDEDDDKLKYLGGIPYLSNHAVPTPPKSGWRRILGLLSLWLASWRAVLGLALLLIGLLLICGALIDLWLQA
jgi:hypothetical protein